MPLIEIERRDEAAVVRFQRPPVNAFNLEFVEELRERAEELAAEVPAAGVVITGEGRAFSGGVDFKQVPGYDPEQRVRMVGGINAVMTLLYGLPTATVAAVNGSAIGGAFVLMLACDARIASAGDAKLALTEVTAGIPYPACPLEVVKAEIEPSLRRHLVLSGEPIDPATAWTRGLVDEVVAPQELLEKALELARVRAAAPSYVRVKEQLKREALARMREIVETGRDPMLAEWV